MFVMPILAVLIFILSMTTALTGELERAVASEKCHFKVEVLAEGLEKPWGIVRLPDGRFLVTEQPGRLRVIEDGVLIPEPVSGIPEVAFRGQGGLLDIELHPDYAQNGWIYLSYADPKGDTSMTKIVRGRLKGNAFTDLETIFEAPAADYSRAGAHFGNRMEFGPDGCLYFTIGDRGSKTTPEENNAQKLSNAAGKSHRVKDNGSIPADNPFVATPGAVKSIWTLGNRNAQGLKFHPKTGALWASEHGPRGGDEINILKKGLNYGWPLVTYGINYDGTPISDKTEAPGLESPILHWTPSIAVAGIDFYHGDQFPAWRGNLFATALAHQKLVRMEVDGDKITHQEILLEGTGRIRDVLDSGDGFLVLVYDTPGRVVRLVPAED